MPPGDRTGEGEIYIEFLQQGGFIKATAIDPSSGVEATVTGPAGSAREALSTAAIRKLRYLLAKKHSRG